MTRLTILTRILTRFTLLTGIDKAHMYLHVLTRLVVHVLTCIDKAHMYLHVLTRLVVHVLTCIDKAHSTYTYIDKAHGTYMC